MPHSPLSEALSQHDRSANFILTARCADALGNVAALSDFLRTRDAFIIDSQQHDDPVTGSFLSNIASSAAGLRFPVVDELCAAFAPVAERLGKAHSRGLKIIRKTAHYVTGNIDQVPIIVKHVARVDHGSTPEALVEIRQDVEASVLARAVRWHAERRVLPDGQRTVVFK